MRYRIAVGLLLFALPARPAEPPSSAARQEWLSKAAPPHEYVIAKFARHKVVILGEAHWIRQDAMLVAELVPRLRGAGVGTLAMEVLPASEQSGIDRLVEGAEWNQREAVRILRVADWPWREYLEIIHAVWKANASRDASQKPLRLLAVGPGSDWRQTLLPKGETYDSFMAKRVLDSVETDRRGRVLLYCGAHHAFTRFFQPELPASGDFVDRFMERTGNFLWRDLGQDVFLVTLHWPWRCRAGSEWEPCLPARGAIDCAAADRGTAVGFDVAGSPFEDLPLDPRSWYAMGRPSPRLVDFTDGYVWTAPVEELRGATLIPLDEYAPDERALTEVAAHNPFTDDSLPPERLPALWREEEDKRKDTMKFRKWESLRDWRTNCR